MAQVAQNRSRKAELVIVSEYLRLRLHCGQPSMIKDRRYHARLYQKCFVGRELVDWLVEHLEATNRNIAVQCMRALQDIGLIHHVCDDHQFKDQMLFYRFRRDDGSGGFDKETEFVFQAVDLYNRILADQKKFVVLQDIQYNGQVFKTCFFARRFIDWLVLNGETHSRDEGVEIGKAFLQTGVIKQLSPSIAFQDDSLYYQFRIEDMKTSKLMNVVNLSELDKNKQITTSTKKDGTPIKNIVHFFDDMAKLQVNKSKELNRRRHSSFDTPPNTPPNMEDVQISPRPVVLRDVTVEELEDRRNPYVMTKISILRDAVGYGFVVRGSMPVYVQTVDPDGPAAAAGVKVRQYIHSVNGKYVLRWTHREVADVILNSPNVVELVVMNHFRGS
ncbi:DEP domain-containing mTOR-interacting protein-like [Dendronephthya gigantea]|uniref:DEP domain-containing mTOR-interacting protein-like n=1 Tax=Dendronephthya gigantea TaxID=151771 RepID=UPI00106B051D|nr:DEP domain-containing mTOR-interacting protein-like [Dendronephthya gigantea]